MIGSPRQVSTPFLGRVKSVHMVGVGGIGMSGLAVLLSSRGVDVSGCDRSAGPGLDRLRQAGMRVAVGHDAAHVRDADLVVASSAVPPDSPELETARELGVPVITRGELLAELSRRSELIAVAGAHGKTTVTSMIAKIVVDLGLDPTVALGGMDRHLGGNARSGGWDLFLAEADESDGSFLLLRPSTWTTGEPPSGTGLRSRSSWVALRSTDQPFCVWTTRQCQPWWAA